MPEGTLTKHLTALLATAETLNQTSNSINTILNAVEQELVKANIGLEVWLEADYQSLSRSTAEHTESDGTRYTCVELGFARLTDGWHLAARDICVEEGPTDNDGAPTWVNSSCDRDPYPIAQASRRERIKALRFLPNLIKKLHQEAEQAIKTIEDAKKLIVC